MSDTLATLQKALAPKTGMRSLPFPVESYEHPSRPFNYKHLLNLAAEAGPPDSISPFMLNPTSGLVPIGAVGAGPWYAFNANLVGGYYIVSGDHLFRNIGGTTTDLGSVGTMVNPYPPSTIQSMVTIAMNPRAAVICVPPRLFYIYHDDPTLHEIDASGWETNGAGTVTYIDGYWVVTSYGPGTTFVLSSLNDPASWPGDFANVEGMVSILLRAVTHRGQLWLLGAGGAEVWYDAGAADFPFRRMEGVSIQHGSIARSVAILNGAIWWVTRERLVVRSDGYSMKRISTHFVERLLEPTDPEQCFATSYTDNGHGYYCLTLPDIGRTLCFDTLTEKWHDRSSAADGAGAWRPSHLARIGEAVYAGDASGMMYILDPNGNTDNGVAMIRQATLPPLYVDGHRVFCARAQIELETGDVNASINLDWSDDGGNNFSGGPRVLTTGVSGDPRKRVFTTRLGSFRERMFRFTTHDRTVFYNMTADVAAPASLSGANS